MIKLKRADGTLLKSSELLELLTKMKDYIQSTEVILDWEMGDRRDFDKIHKFGPFPFWPSYDLICELLSNNTKNHTTLNSSSADSSMLTLQFKDGTERNYTEDDFYKLKSTGMLWVFHPDAPMVFTPNQHR